MCTNDMLEKSALVNILYETCQSLLSAFISFVPRLLSRKTGKVLEREPEKFDHIHCDIYSMYGFVCGF